MNSKRLNILNKNDVIYFNFPHIEKTQMVHHGFSTKHGGVSNGCYSTMNLGLNRGDDPHCVRENYKRLCKAIDVEYDSLVLSDQVHSNKILAVNRHDCGKGLTKESDIVGVDGLITNDIGVTLTTFYADCVPLFFVDTKNKAIGLSHAGWRGTVMKIAQETIQAMADNYGSKAEDLLIGIGPSVGQCCYEVSKDVILQFEKEMNHDIIDKIVRQTGKDHYMLNLWEANRQLLLGVGVRADHIVVTDICTQCHSEDLYSHRVMGGQRGSLAAMMALIE